MIGHLLKAVEGGVVGDDPPVYVVVDGGRVVGDGPRVPGDLPQGHVRVQVVPGQHVLLHFHADAAIKDKGPAMVVKTKFCVR